MSLQINPQTDAVDPNELTYLISNHLLREMQAHFTSNEVKRVNVDVSPTVSQAKQKQDSGLAFSSDNDTPTHNDFAVSGDVFFVDSEGFEEVTDMREVGTAYLGQYEVDVLVEESFTGESGNEFLRCLQNAEDDALQNTNGISVTESDSSRDEEIIDNYLGSSYRSTDGDPIISQRLYVLASMFGVGFLLVALYVFKTRQVKKIDQENEIDAIENVSSGITKSLVSSTNIFQQLLCCILFRLM